jgi:hypothetical protein
MLLLANSFAFGCVAGGVVVSLFSCFLIRDAEAGFFFVCAGYSVVGCISALLYAPPLKLLAFGRREITRADTRRAFITAAACMIAEYLFAAIARTHQYDRTLLLAVPPCAALVDACRLRMSARSEEVGLKPSAG